MNLAINLLMDADYSIVQDATNKMNPRRFATIESITAAVPYLTYFTQSK